MNIKLILCINCINCKKKKNGKISCLIGYFDEDDIKNVKTYTPFDFECIDYEEIS